MSVELMLYIYLFVCVSMIAFNFAAALLFKHNDKKTLRVSGNFKTEVMLQLETIKNGGICKISHQIFLSKRLKRVGNMIAFDKMLEDIYAENSEAVRSYLSQLDHVFIALTKSYCGKDTIETAYFPYIIKKYRLISSHSIPAIEDTLLSLLDEPSIYCRENAMQALYSTGNIECVIKALKKIDKSDMFFHGKLLTDGLLEFAGDKETLYNTLVSEFHSFSADMQVNIINFLRFSTSRFSEFAYSLLCDEKQDDELRYACIRYLGKYRYDKAYDKLCCFAENLINSKWQYTAIASSALAAYPGDRTLDLLKKNLYSHNWYVRFNSSDSLERLGVSYTQLADVIDGNDRYASEILRYRLQRKNSAERSGATV